MTWNLGLSHTWVGTTVACSKHQGTEEVMCVYVGVGVGGVEVCRKLRGNNSSKFTSRVTTVYMVARVVAFIVTSNGYLVMPTACHARSHLLLRLPAEVSYKITPTPETASNVSCKITPPPETASNVSCKITPSHETASNVSCKITTFPETSSPETASNVSCSHAFSRNFLLPLLLLPPLLLPVLSPHKLTLH